MPDNILIRIDEALVDVRRMLARVHADIQVVRHDIEQLRNVGQNKTLHRTFKPTSYDSSLKSGESHESTGRRERHPTSRRRRHLTQQCCELATASTDRTIDTRLSRAIDQTADQSHRLRRYR